VLYLDSASTTQKPRRVLDAVGRHLSGGVANPGRGSYAWATRAAAALDDARRRVARFVGAGSPDQVVFTSGATSALHAVALAWGWTALRDGDEILFSPLNHASNVLPWVHLRERLAATGRRVRLVPYRFTEAGEVDVADVRAKLSPRTRLVTVPHVHHVFGGLTTLEELRGELPERVRVCVDASQSAGHRPVDVQELGADFLVVAGHKMLALPGVGVLSCAPRVHDELGPFLPGGGSDVALTADGVGEPGGLRVTGMPWGLEGGTPNLVGILALAEAVQVVESVGTVRIAEHGALLTDLLVTGLRARRGVRLLPGPGWCAAPGGHGIVSFTVDGVRAEDVGFALADLGCYVRAGLHCLPGRSGSEPSVRVSVHLYTAPAQVEEFLRLLDHVVTAGG
jgi:cysteine desulfurase / selenocysteine lyase